MKKFSTLTCFCCDKTLTNWEYETDDGYIVNVQPMEGLHFQTCGHYGSTVFDPMDGTSLDIAICDECIMKKRSIIHGNGVTHLG